MLAPLGPVIMAVIQMPGVGIGGTSIYHRERERERERKGTLSRKRDTRGRRREENNDEMNTE